MITKFNLEDKVKLLGTGRTGLITNINISKNREVTYMIDYVYKAKEDEIEKVTPVTKKDLLNAINDRRFGVLGRIEELAKRILADGYDG